MQRKKSSEVIEPGDDRSTENFEFDRSFFENLNLPFKIPLYIQNLLMFNGYDNIKSISEFKDESYAVLEKFAKEDLPELTNPGERKLYYGIYASNIKAFKIPEGHKILIDSLIKHCQTIVKKTNVNPSGGLSTKGAIKRKRLGDEANGSNNANLSENEDVVKHIQAVTKNYVTEFCGKSLSEEHSSKILEKIAAKNIEVQLVKNSDQQMSTTNLFAKITCFLCESTIKVHPSRCGKKWILSNFNGHFKNHFVQKQDKKTCVPKKPVLLQNYTIDNFFSKPVNTPRDTQSSSKPKSTMSNSPSPPIIDLEEDIDIDQDAGHDTSQDNFHEGGNVSETIVSAVSVKSSLKDELKEKYSRRERNLRALKRCGEDQDQTKITDFYNVVTEVRTIMNENVEIQDDILPLAASYTGENSINGFLDLLQKTALQNSKVRKHGNRFSEPLKLFALYIFIIGGRMTYELLYANMPNTLPSISTINRSLDSTHKINEGEVRFVGLKEFLSKKKCPPRVFVSEDQTAILKRPLYDPNTNKIVGFVGPYSQGTGFPVTDKFEVSSVTDVERMFQNETLAINAYAVMAQPLMNQAPSYCLSVFGSDNRFTHEDVMRRWAHLEEQAKSHGIEIFGFSTDGDTRCLKAMLLRSGLSSATDVQNPYGNIFKMNYDPDSALYVQDTVHIATKLKTRLLKPNTLLPIGNYNVSMQHLQDVLRIFHKDQHFLCSSDLNCLDKMNYEAIDKLSNRRVTDLLDNIKDSQATKQFLIVTRYIIDSYLDKNISVEERIYKIWYCVFFLRIWKQWLKENNFSSVKNCITSNTYSCIELNAHSLLLAIEKIRKSESANQPTLREDFQRYAFDDIYIFNNDILRRLNRIQCLNEISTDLSNDFRFPREEHKKLGNKANVRLENDMPSQSQVKDTLLQAKYDAVSSCQHLGMTSENMDKWCCSLDIDSKKGVKCNTNETNTLANTSSNAEVTSQNDTENEIQLSDNEYNQDMLQDAEVFTSLKSLALKDYTDKNVHRSNSFLSVKVNDKPMRIRKSSLVWFYYDKRGRLSSDRLQRVRGHSNNTSNQAQKQRKPDTVKRNLTKKTWKNSKAKVASKSQEEDSLSFSDREDTETETESDQYCSESELENYVSESNDEMEEEKEGIKIEIEKYYSVFYDSRWYVGRVLNIDDNTCRVKFLKEDLDVFVWPAQEDVQEIEKQFIGIGPLNLTGVNKFKISRSDRLKIEKRFKMFKKT